MKKEQIIKYYQKLHRDEVKKTGQKIPQTIIAKKIRCLLRLIEEIPVMN